MMGDSLSVAGLLSGTPYVSEAAQQPDSNRAELRIYISTHELQVLITDESGLIRYLHPFELTDGSKNFFQPGHCAAALKHSRQMPENPRSVHIGFAIPAFALVPGHYQLSDHIFELEDKKPGDHNGHRACTDLIEGHHVALTYRVPFRLLEELKNHFADFRYSHSVSRQLLHLLNVNKGLGCYALLSKDWVTLLALSGNKVNLANSFPVKSAEDFVYYLMAVYDTLKLNPEEVPLIVYGEVIKDSAIYQLANKYIRHVSFGESSGKLKYHHDYPFPPHFYSSLLSL
jgi:hypothetical protein